MKIQNLQRQVKQQTTGDYLSFKSGKGNTVYYVGEIKNDMANGKGIALFGTGSRYEGEWKNNLRHGKGLFTGKMENTISGAIRMINVKDSVSIIGLMEKSI